MLNTHCSLGRDFNYLLSLLIFWIWMAICIEQKEIMVVIMNH